MLGTRFVEPPSEASLRVYGCQGGTGTVELRAGSITGRLLDSTTITVNRPQPTATPPAVSNLVATASTTSVRLTWDDLDGATKYRVEHRLSTSTGSWTPVDTTANVRNVANLTPETSYAFRIRAYGDGTTYKAAWGAEAATTASTVGIVPLAKPPAPGGLSASSSGENSVSVSWTALTGADKYEVPVPPGLLRQLEYVQERHNRHESHREWPAMRHRLPVQGARLRRRRQLSRGLGRVELGIK